jgi:hypothetical protein
MFYIGSDFNTDKAVIKGSKELFSVVTDNVALIIIMLMTAFKITLNEVCFLFSSIRAP